MASLREILREILLPASSDGDTTWLKPGRIFHQIRAHARRRVISRYWDRPMDFAGATLGYLAKRGSFSTILTVDPTDSETYRIQGRH